MNKKNNSKFYNIITELPKTEEDLNKQRKYDLLIGIMVILPIFIMIILSLIGNIVIGIFVLVICYIILVLIGINKRKKIISNFYKIKDAYEKINIINTDDEHTIISLYNNSALTFLGPSNNELLNFIYNWLNNEKVLKNEMLDLYVINGSKLKKVFKQNKFSDDVVFMCIFLKDLKLNDENKKSFSDSHFIVGARWLDDLIKINKNQGI